MGPLIVTRVPWVVSRDPGKQGSASEAPSEGGAAEGPPTLNDMLVTPTAGTM